MEKQNETPFVDIRSVIRSKSPALERWLPGFIIRYLINILHQDEINHIIATYGHHKGIQMADTIYHYFGINIDTHGFEQVPEDGRYLFVSNHPLGGLDGAMLIKVIGEKFKNVKSIVNDFLLYLTPFEEVFVPVNKHGRQTQDYAKRIHDTYDSDAQIIYFPAGLCSRKVKGQIVDPPWKRNVLQKAVKYRRNIVPVFFSGQNSPFFYRLANIRKRLRIPFNLEMLYLSDEAFKKKGAHFDIYFGTPIPYTSFTPDKSPDFWIGEVRKKVYSLPELSKTNL